MFKFNWRFDFIGGVGDAEIAGVEIAARECRGRNSGRRKSMKSEDFKNVFLTILSENRVIILACLAHRVEIDSNVTAAHSWAE